MSLPLTSKVFEFLFNIRPVCVGYFKIQRFRFRWKFFFVLNVKLPQDMWDIGTRVCHLSFDIVLVVLLCQFLYLIFNLFQYRCRSCWHWVEVFHCQLVELLTQVFFNRFNKEIQISHVMQSFVLVSRGHWLIQLRCRSFFLLTTFWVCFLWILSGWRWHILFGLASVQLLFQQISFHAWRV